MLCLSPVLFNNDMNKVNNYKLGMEKKIKWNNVVYLSLESNLLFIF